MRQSIQPSKVMFPLFPLDPRFRASQHLLPRERVSCFVAELLCGRRTREWSPKFILRGVLVIFYGHGRRNGSRARASYVRMYVRTSHFMTFLIT